MNNHNSITPEQNPGGPSMFDLGRVPGERSRVVGAAIEHIQRLEIMFRLQTSQQPQPQPVAEVVAVPNAPYVESNNVVALNNTGEAVNNSGVLNPDELRAQIAQLHQAMINGDGGNAQEAA